MYALKSNFYPASEPKNGYIGKADITIAEALRINNVSVFENPEDKSRSIAFAKFGSNDEYSYVVPSSKEAYAAMLDVISKAVDNKDHYAYEKGEYKLNMEVKGVKVNEQYADGRYSVSLGDFCTLNGISTREASYTTPEGEKKDWVAVDLPVVRDEEGKVKMYTDKDGKQRADLQYEGIKRTFVDKAGKEGTLNYQIVLQNRVRKCRDELNQSLDVSIETASSKKTAPTNEKQSPDLEQSR